MREQWLIWQPEVHTEHTLNGTAMSYANRNGTIIFVKVFIHESRPSSAKYPVQSNNAVHGAAIPARCLERLGHGANHQSQALPVSQSEHRCILPVWTNAYIPWPKLVFSVEPTKFITISTLITQHQFNTLESCPNAITTRQIFLSSSSLG